MRLKKMSVNFVLLLTLLFFSKIIFASTLPQMDSVSNLVMLINETMSATTEDLISNLVLNFNSDEKVNIEEENDLDFVLNKDLLSVGTVQFKSDLDSRDNFFSDDDRYAGLLKLGKSFFDILNSGRDYNSVFVSKYAYLLKNFNPDLDGQRLYRIEEFRKKAFPTTTFIFPEEFHLSSQEMKNVDFDWLVIQKLGYGFSDVKSKMKFVTYDNTGNKIASNQRLLLSQDQRSALLRVTNELKGRLPDKVTVALFKKIAITDNTRLYGIGEDHSSFNSSVSINCYYKINSTFKSASASGYTDLANKNTPYLVIVFQIAAINKPWFIPRTIFRLGANDLSGRISDIIYGMRTFFDKI
ncbi:MAG: hypothetical protein HQK51_09085 [Oligoflexia bacterium]|nr:hypothetical protein [Oligoflexia bacterium]